MWTQINGQIHWCAAIEGIFKIPKFIDFSKLRLRTNGAQEEEEEENYVRIKWADCGESGPWECNVQIIALYYY